LGALEQVGAIAAALVGWRPAFLVYRKSRHNNDRFGASAPLARASGKDSVDNDIVAVADHLGGGLC